MSSAVWRQHFRYVRTLPRDRSPLISARRYSYNRYTQIAARAVRQSLKESERLKAEKRGLTALRYQNWENGQGGEQVSAFPLFLVP